MKVLAKVLLQTVGSMIYRTIASLGCIWVTWHSYNYRTWSVYCTWIRTYIRLDEWTKHMLLCVCVAVGRRHWQIWYNATFRRSVSFPGRCQAYRRHCARPLCPRHQPQRGRLCRLHDAGASTAAAGRHKTHQRPTTNRARQQGVSAPAGQLRARPRLAGRTTVRRADDGR